MSVFLGHSVYPCRLIKVFDNSGGKKLCVARRTFTLHLNPVIHVAQNFSTTAILKTKIFTIILRCSDSAGRQDASKRIPVYLSPKFSLNIFVKALADTNETESGLLIWFHVCV